MLLPDIFNLSLSADFVVLSACETGMGKEVKGEGIVGMTRAFLYAGAKSVVVSLWKVDDRATAALMEKYYLKVLNSHLTGAAALRGAQLEVWEEERWKAPYFWAGFEVQGEWR